MRIDKGKRPISLGKLTDLCDTQIEVSVSRVGARPRYIVYAFSTTNGRAKFTLDKEGAQELASLLTEGIFVGEPEEE